MTMGNERERCGEALKAHAEKNAGLWASMTDYEANLARSMWQQAWSAATAPRTPPPNTVRVRIPVVVNSKGEYVAIGYSGETDGQLLSRVREIAIEELHGVTREHFITADVPLPPRRSKSKGRCPMPKCLVREPDGRYAVWSTILNKFRVSGMKEPAAVPWCINHDATGYPGGLPAYLRDLATELDNIEQTGRAWEWAPTWEEAKSLAAGAEVRRGTDTGEMG